MLQKIKHYGVVILAAIAGILALIFRSLAERRMGEVIDAEHQLRTAEDDHRHAGVLDRDRDLSGKIAGVDSKSEATKAEIDRLKREADEIPDKVGGMGDDEKADLGDRLFDSGS